VAWAGGTLTIGSGRARWMYESLSAMLGNADLWVALLGGFSWFGKGGARVIKRSGMVAE